MDAPDSAGCRVPSPAFVRTMTATAMGIRRAPTVPMKVWTALTTLSATRPSAERTRVPPAVHPSAPLARNASTQGQQKSVTVWTTTAMTSSTRNRRHLPAATTACSATGRKSAMPVRASPEAIRATMRVIVRTTPATRMPTLVRISALPRDGRTPAAAIPPARVTLICGKEPVCGDGFIDPGEIMWRTRSGGGLSAVCPDLPELCRLWNPCRTPPFSDNSRDPTV